MTYYTMALGLLELASPYVFENQHQTALQESLACFMDMMRSYYNRREAFSGFVEKIVAFLHLYLEHNAQDASQFVQENREVLWQYQQATPNSHALKQLSNIFQLSVEDGDSKCAPKTPVASKIWQYYSR